MLLDLPVQALSDDQWPRAVRFFGRLGVDAHEQFAFNLELHSVVEAVDLAVRIFDEVYRLDLGEGLTITEE